jgi:hypothetical protein
MIIMGTILLICGTFVAVGAARSLGSGKTEEREDLPPIARNRNPIKYHIYVFACMSGAVAMILFGAILLAVRISRDW